MPGLAGRSWPDEYGGRSAPAWQDEVVAEVQSNYGVSTKMAAVALEMLPAVLFEHGTHEQRLTHLPCRRAGGRGMVPTSLRARRRLGSRERAHQSAVPVEGGWSVQGQKVWTSGAGCASFALLLARTEPDVAGTAGLSCLILDMSDPGVRVRAVAPDVGWVPLQRGLSRRRVRSRYRVDRRTRRRSGRAAHHVGERAGRHRRGHQRPLRRPARRSGAPSRPSARAAACARPSPRPSSASASST